VERVGADLGGFLGLAERSAESDSTFVEVVRGDGDRHDVARKNADEVLAHLSRDVGNDLMAVVQLDAKLRVRKGLRHFALYLKCFLFGHKALH
jgi:hypothetical protein